MSARKQDDHKFDTSSLLRGVDDDDGYSLDEILLEYGDLGQEKDGADEKKPPKESTKASARSAPEQTAASPVYRVEPLDEPEPAAPAVPEPVQAKIQFQFVRMENSNPGQKTQTVPLTPDEPADDMDRPLPGGIPATPPRPAVPQEKRAVSPRETGSWRQTPEKREKPIKEGQREQKKVRREKPAPAPRPEPSLRAAYKYYAKSVPSIRFRIFLNFLVCLVLAGLVVGQNYTQSLPSVLAKPGALAGLTLILLLLSALLSFDVLAHGVFGIFQGKFGAESLLLCSAVATAVSTFQNRQSTQMPICAVTALGFLFAQWGLLQRRVACRRSLKVATLSKQPVSVVRVQELWEGKPCIVKTQKGAEGFMTDLEADSLPEIAMRRYAPFAAVAGVAFAAFGAFHTKQNFLPLLALLWAGAVPLAAPICYARPFALLSGRLMREGAAVSGWTGAERLSGECGIAFCDQDLYPAGNVALNGLKVFREFRPEQVISYTSSLVEASGSGLAPLFEELLKQQPTKTYQIGGFSVYEGGGLGAEIRGDEVLVGSVSFLQLMGIRLPQGTNMRQAIYTAINGELAGVFAVSYKSGKSIGAALQTALESRRLSPVFATRDFLITPAMIRQEYELSEDRLEFPTVKARAGMSAEDAATGGERGALLSRDAAQPYVDAVAGARSLCSYTRVNTIFTLAGGVGGLVLLLFLTACNMTQTVTAFNLLVYTFVWTLIPIVMSNWIRKG